MIQDTGDGEPLGCWEVVLDIMGPHQDLERGGGHDCAGVAGEGAVGGSEDVAGRDDGASAEWDILPGENHGDLGETWTHFIYVFIEKMLYKWSHLPWKLVNLRFDAPDYPCCFVSDATVARCRNRAR